MKARLLLTNDEKEYLILYADGTISKATKAARLFFLEHFKSIGEQSGTDGSWRTECADMSVYPGETQAYISDNLELVLYTFEAFHDLLEKPIGEGSVSDRYISSDEYAILHGKSAVMITHACKEGKILGAEKIGNLWLIPKDTPYPNSHAGKKLKLKFKKEQQPNQ